MGVRTPLIWPVTALAAFAVLMPLAVGDWPPLQRADAAVSAASRAYGERHPAVIDALRLVTAAGDTLVVGSAAAAAAVVLAVRGHRRAALFTAAATAAVIALWSLMHLLLYRPRPVGGFVAISSNGFPSGHTGNAAAAALIVGFLLWRRLAGRARMLVVTAAAGYAVTIGVSRVLLLAHWPSDVVGGWLLALTVVPLVRHATGAGREPGRRVPPDVPTGGHLAW